MEEKKFLGMRPNVVFGLTWLVFPFGIVALAVDHSKMDKNDKQQIVSAFVLDGIWTILSIIVSIVDSVLRASTDGASSSWFWIVTLVVHIPLFVFWLIAMIQAFRGIEYHCPIAWGIAGCFLGDDKKEEAKPAEAKAEEVKEEPKEEAKEE